MPKNNTSAWRALSTLIQTNISTAQAANSLFYFEGDPLEPEPETYFVNSDEMTGELLPTQKRLLTKKFGGTHKGKATPHLVAMFASMAMGKDTAAVVGATTAYSHKIEIDKTIVELPKRTLVENDGFQQFSFVGVACPSFKLSGQRGGFVEFEAELLGTGSEAADVTAKPARVNESYLTYGDCKLLKGGTYNGSAITGATDISAQLIDFNFSFKNNGKGVYLFGDSSGQVGSTRRGQRYEVELEASIEIEDASIRTDFLAGNEFVMSIPMVGGVANGAAKYTVEAIFPRVAYKEAKKGLNEGTLKVGAKMAVLADPVYGGLIINIINLQATSYLVTA